LIAGKISLNRKNTGIQADRNVLKAAESAAFKGKFPKRASREFFAALQGIISALQGIISALQGIHGNFYG
jgi:hypothetical protein